MDEVKSLFQTRDQAVAKKNKQLFASTQIQDIPYASISGYISCSSLETNVLNVVDDTDFKKVVFVKENYGTHWAFLLYYLVNTVNGWKIYDIVSSLRLLMPA